MCIHSLQIGSVQVKSTHRKLKGPKSLRFATILADPTWTQPLPINVYLIEHSEGFILIDTGEMAQASQPDYYPNFIYRQILKLKIRPEEEAGPQLKEFGISTGDIRKVILTHLHSDHAGGLHHFPKAEILLSRMEYNSGFGQMRERWPNWFKPNLIDYRTEPVGPFEQSFRLTKAGDVVIVPTPGHTAGHQSVILEREGISYFFAGDASFTEQELLDEQLAGISQNLDEARQTLRQIKRYVAQTPTVYLPAHDHHAKERLANKNPVKV
jgi:glyoxylase-like metal-dependent hydrolase (beta-lactamase superfamily II)